MSRRLTPLKNFLRSGHDGGPHTGTDYKVSGVFSFVSPQWQADADIFVRETFSSWLTYTVK
jgi:hypothetical protein